MAEKHELLVLRLEGVLQSWGENSLWDFRDCGIFPTKSAIVGLLGCALGIHRGSPALVSLAQSVTVGVRADRPGVMIQDYQTVTGHDLMTADGIPRVSNTFVSPRNYLSDACFTVFIAASSSLLEELDDALHFPKWSIYLGRRSCVPSRPVFQERTDIYENILDAIKHYPTESRSVEVMPYECEIDLGNGPYVTVFRPDVLNNPDRQFGVRQVWRSVVRKEELQ